MSPVHNGGTEAGSGSTLPLVAGSFVPFRYFVRRKSQSPKGACAMPRSWPRLRSRPGLATPGRHAALLKLEILEDRTAPSVTQVTDLNLPPQNAYPSHLTDVNGTLFFIAGTTEKTCG